MNRELLGESWSTGATAFRRGLSQLRDKARKAGKIDYWPVYYKMSSVPLEEVPSDAWKNTLGDWYWRVPFDWLLRFYWNFPTRDDADLFLAVWNPVYWSYNYYHELEGAYPKKKIYTKAVKMSLAKVWDYWEYCYDQFVRLVPPGMKTREWLIDHPDKILNLPPNNYGSNPATDLYKPVQHAIAIIDSFGYETEFMRFPELQKAMRDICDTIGMDPETGRIYNPQRTKAVLSAVPKYTPVYKKLAPDSHGTPPDGRDVGDYGDKTEAGGATLASMVADPFFLTSAVLGFFLARKLFKRGKK